MKIYIKQAFLPFIYLIFVAISAMAIVSIDANLLWLKIILSILNVGLYLCILCGTSFMEGQTALKVRVANDLEREIIIRTGEDRHIRKHEEFKWWKGILIGVLSCVPMLVLLLVHTILTLINPTLNGCGVVTAFIYMAFFSFIMLNGGGTTETVTPMPPQAFYFALISLPIIACACGIAYYLGGKKIQLQQDAIKAKRREIYGE